MIACARCGWAAHVERDAEAATWAQHTERNICDGEPLRAYPSLHRAPVCVKGHPRDALGICWTCTTARWSLDTAPARARIRRRR